MFSLHCLKSPLSRVNSKCSAALLRNMCTEASKNPAKLESLRQSDHTPTTYDKFILVWAKKYPSMNEVPHLVPQKVMEKARSVSRIRINIIMCILTATVCVLMVIAGKHSMKKGDNLMKKNLEWHKMQNQK